MSLELGSKVVMKNVARRDREGVVIYLGTRAVRNQTRLMWEWFNDPAERRLLDEARTVGRLQPENFRELARGKTVPQYLFGPIIVKVIRLHKTTGVPLKPRYFSRERRDIRVIGERQMDRLELLME